jgi:hypothetical protein
VAVLVVVGYLVYKKAGGGSLSASGSEGDASGLTTGGGGDAALADLLGGGSGVIDPSYFIGGSVPDEVGSSIPSYSYAINPTAFTITPQLDIKIGKDSGSVPASVSKVATQRQETVKTPKASTTISILGGQIASPASAYQNQANQTSVLGGRVAPAAQNAAALQNSILGAQRLQKMTPAQAPKQLKQVTPV